MMNNLNSINSYLKDKFGCKVVKLSIDGGFTCPNRDGTKGIGGCSFCSSSGSGDLASNIPDQLELLSTKWPNAKHLAYFQNHTNTYAPVNVLREKFEAALGDPNIMGLVIATRPDCLSAEVLELLSELNERTFLWVELGLQTIHEKTADKINRCYPLSVYDEAIVNLKAHNIRTVVHLILGLPGESPEEMLQSVSYVCRNLNTDQEINSVPEHIFGIKLHMFNLVSGSPMSITNPNYISFPSIEAYVDMIISALELVPAHVTIHRISGDAPRSTLIAPEWSYKKLTILNLIHKTMKERGTFQGAKCK
ncbi:MAG: TIGR01212 family radical SAM protein [Anaerovoracaceae bacterium]